MVNVPDFSLETLKNEFENTDSKWRKESRLLLMQLKGVSTAETDIMRFNTYFEAKNAIELAPVIEALYKAGPSPEGGESLKAILDIVMNRNSEEKFVKDLIGNASLCVLFKIFETHVSWKSHPEKVFYFFHLIVKYNPTQFGQVINEFLTVFTHFRTLYRPDLEELAKLYMFIFYIYDLKAFREVIPRHPELYRAMINLSVLAVFQPQLFTSEVLRPFGLPQLENPANLFYLGFSCLCTKLEPSLHTTVPEDKVLKLFENFCQQNVTDKDDDVIILAIFYGLCTWRQILGDNLMVLFPANVYNMREKTFRNFNDFPMKFDIDVIHRGIGKKKSDTKKLIDTLKITVLLLKKYLKSITQVSFFGNFDYIEHSTIWNYLLTSLLLFNEYMLVTNLIALQPDIPLCNLLMLQIHLASGKVREALTTANELILNMKEERFHRTPFRSAILLENCYVSLPPGAMIQYVALIQAHCSFLILVQSRDLSGRLRDFMIGNILIMAQVLQRYGEGDVLSRQMANIVSVNESFAFPDFVSYICQSHTFAPFFKFPFIKWHLHSTNSSTVNFQDALESQLAHAEPSDLDALAMARKFIKNHVNSFNEIKNC